ncbi:uncharacterized protein CC84DRAFT_1161400 [Paraphaeosphaeria sporulosa]|uniref:Uncharacterized protein n=1 Tax=Paraphaeosphaeria sporulosa TaxID=1460663 RepID=A0A177CTE7_9PLEO|nr:uncharacterized protein CC84DRAFT_1161400 [Paraphaeosphaeria sporulosa]OAG10461.1 hypothetical protein CC84DRAFT_1161400 [Paraphaeosphaeria sporulosa]
MSAPSSEGRLSTSSMPSVTSSPTLNSRYSDVYADNGEGSSSQRPSLAGSRQNSGGRSHVQEEQSQHFGDALRDEAVRERDFAQRKRNRRSGGFLLDSAFSNGPRSRHAHQSGSGKDAKRKQTNDRSANAARHAATGIASGSPLSREVSMAEGVPAQADRRVDSVNTEEHASDGILVAKTRARLSAVPPSAPHQEQPDATTPRPAFDPNQIVHMALSLNESRRRNMSAGQLLTPQAHVTSGRRRDGSVNSPSTGSGHLRQYLNEQRRASRNISPFGDKSPARHMSMSAQRRGSVLIQGQQGKEPSPATWQRVDKARAFIELRVEYLRLLEFLPPLKPDSSAPGNFVVMANNVPGSPHAQLTRIPSHANKHHDLGRPYNPLQVLRNRRSRARERKSFDHPPEEFADVEQVHKWVDRVEEAAQSFMYRQLDRVALPRLHESHATAADHAKPARPSKIWMFSSEELLADAHWLEHSDNKTIVEDRYGRKIFPAKEPQKQDLLSARPSKEYPDKRRRSWVEGIVADNHNTTGDESEALSERGRKRRLLPTFRAESPKYKKHNWIGSRQQAGSNTDSSDSESDLEKRRSKKTQKMVEGDNETGALKLRMKHLMETEVKETQRAETPLLFTPDTPNKWGQGTTDGHDEKGVRSSFEVSDSANGSVKANLAGPKLPPKQRNDPELSKDPSKEYRSSFEEFDSTAPSTPLYPRHYPHIDGDTSPSVSRAGSHKKPKKSKLDFLRSEETKARHDQDHLVPDSAGSDKKRSSRHAIEEAEEGNGISSAIWAAPGAVKNFLGHRKNDSVNSLTSPIKDKDRKDAKEPPSAVTRFIKGVKNESSKMGGFIFRKEGPADESDTDAASDGHLALESETDEDYGSLRRRKTPKLARSSTAETAGSVTSKTSKKATGYHLELPSFRPQSKIDEDSASELSDNHISRQSRETAKNRSPRFDKLAPPGLDLSRISSSSSRSASQDRINRLLARPGGVGHAGLPVTSLAKDRLRSSSADASPKRRPSRPTLEGRRHWSITDSQKDLSRSKSSDTIEVTPSEIARVRALYLCSGIKAKEINRRALEIRNPPASFLVRAAASAHRDLYPVARKEEHVLAARILTTAFESRISALQSLARSFREDTVVDLQSRIADLKSNVETSLFARVREGGDDALKVSSQVSADAPLAVKQITDDIEHMVRMRRRRTRWVRRVGWTLLEWALLGFMWCAWLVVTLSRVGTRSVAFFWRIVKWLLWL